MLLKCKALLAALALLVAWQPGVAAPASPQAVAAAVRARLALDDQLAGLAISVDVAGGRLRLRGVAPSTAVRARITAVARQAGSALEVVNEVSVQPRAG
ncbi:MULTISPECIES: BON domain-containing protein [unclassified Roseateles]|uniref:BON domain-containing protein n=1 Tax=unclassified Roseateles TaxID=2626991 RepID=UPI0006F3E809|nr:MULTISPECIES: BON domain-containing protein [unclassified Roseateles]KQW52003.1 hypothetical protein ASC81_05225 [Pelomonas sp. Root405]KRA78237.1 hypothetical protein ASD88_05230 [Pelomonas sp. Root662]